MCLKLHSYVLLLEATRIKVQGNTNTRLLSNNSVNVNDLREIQNESSRSQVVELPLKCCRVGGGLGLGGECGRLHRVGL